ncbi:MAG TPA: tetratricopeptide repeat protein, partial [Bacteroidia bacterium]|nr:tetratricopeptide repeat protein [Bacteroidia bacterium]
MKKVVVLILLLTLTGKVFPQRGDYLKAFTQGNFLFLEKNYDMALQSYKQAYAIDSSNANINYKIGLVYMNLAS